MLRASVCVNGRAKLHHCVQFVMNNVRYVETRSSSSLFIMVGNSHSMDVVINISSEGCETSTNQIHIQPNQKLVIPITYQGGLASIKLVTPFEDIEFGLGGIDDLKTKGVNFLWLNLPSAFPLDSKKYTGFGEGECEAWFHGMQSTSLLELETSKIATPATSDKAGYVYLLTHPNFQNWAKVDSAIDLLPKMAAYQNADPFRRFEIHISAIVDDVTAFTQFILYRARETGFLVENEWIAGDTAKIVKLFEETIGLMKGQA